MMGTIRFLENREGNCLTLINEPTMIISEAMCVHPDKRPLYKEELVMHIRAHLSWPRLSCLDCRTNSAWSLHQRSLQAAPTQHLSYITCVALPLSREVARSSPEYIFLFDNRIAQEFSFKRILQ